MSLCKRKIKQKSKTILSEDNHGPLKEIFSISRKQLGTTR